MVSRRATVHYQPTHSPLFQTSSNHNFLFLKEGIEANIYNNNNNKKKNAILTDRTETPVK